jgi:uncharacterized protein (TIGR00251 family)
MSPSERVRRKETGPNDNATSQRQAPSWVSEEKGTVILRLWVQPGAKRTVIVGERAGLLWVRVAAPPLEGKANDALLTFLAGVLEVPRSSVALRSGERGRQKTVAVTGCTREATMRQLGLEASSRA